jgi:uncharacterized protein YjbI with pentapeptide repeats
MGNAYFSSCEIPIANFSKVRFSGDADFRNAKLHIVNFRRCTFVGQVKFRGAELSFDGGDFQYANFHHTANFAKTNFLNGANFERATFAGDSEFTGTAFSGGARFEHAIFSRNANFNGTTFSRAAHFESTTFSRNANFSGLIFSEETRFERAVFSGDSNFPRANFVADAYFTRVSFSGCADFQHASFSSQADFNGANFLAALFKSCTFCAQTTFRGSSFVREANFQDATFSGNVYFEGVKFRHKANFSAIKSLHMFSMIGARFNRHVPDFLSAKFEDPILLDNVQLSSEVEPGGLLKSICAGWLLGRTDPTLSAKYRTLKRLAAKSEDHINEQIFFRGELRARRYNEDKPWNLTFWFGALYELMADFGRSVVLPIIWPLALCLISSLFYLSQFTGSGLLAFEQLQAQFTQTVPDSFRTQLPGVQTEKPRKVSCEYGTGNPVMASLVLAMRQSSVVGTFENNKSTQLYACLYGYDEKMKTANVPDASSNVTECNALVPFTARAAQPVQDQVDSNVEKAHFFIAVVGGRRVCGLGRGRNHRGAFLSRQA